MQPDLERLWRDAQAHRRAGAAAAAAAACEAIVAADPRRPWAWLMLADLAYGAGRFRLAVENARIAAAAVHESRRWEALADVAHRLRGLGESLLAVRAIREADWSDPAVLAGAERLAQCLALAEQHEDALRALDAAIARLGPSPDRTYLRATTLRHLGRTQASTDEYLRCLALAPDHAAAMLMLATQARRLDAEAQIARVHAALARCAADAPQRAMLEYALFFLLDGRGDADAAWQALMRGAAAKRRELRYDARAEEARDAAIMALCDAAFVAPAHATTQARVPIFIVGMPRTGTTVLERILGNHSQVASAGELDDFHLQLCWQADVCTEEPAAPALLEACRSLDFAAVGRGYLQRTSWRGGGRPFLIDKFPRNVLYAGLIRKALPQAKLICLVRDPLDSCLSNLKELFAGDYYPYSYDPIETAGHCLRFRRLLDHWHKVMPGALLEVRYEALVREPEATARAVMAHCGLAFEPGCVDLLRNTSPSATASSSQVREPLHARNIGAWRRYAGPLAGARALLEAHLPPDAFAAPPDAA
jgi:tetratricopeptide (TPR) repeat protein